MARPPRKTSLFETAAPPPVLPDEDPYGDAPAPEPAVAPTPRRAPKSQPEPAPPPGEGTGAHDEPPPQRAKAATPAGAKVQQVQLYIPVALHTAIAEYKSQHWPAAEVPTYAQLSVWACEDHRKEVLERARKVHQLRRPSTTDVRGTRVPRGTKRARPQMPIGPRYSPGDAQFLNEMAAAAGTVEEQKVARTTIVAAALAVAVKYPPTVRPEKQSGPDEFFG